MKVSGEHLLRVFMSINNRISTSSIKKVLGLIAMKSLVGLGIPCRMTVLRYEAKKSRRYNGNCREGGFQNAAIFIGEESLWGESSG